MAKETSIALMLGGNKKKGSSDNLMSFDPEADMDEGIGSDDAFEDAASSVLQAIHENDSEAFADALKDAIEICMAKHEGGEY
tara:strand:- start:5059 stop:5304 length:246 start_codon:yes stop_codon:yes gene_type:complete